MATEDRVVMVTVRVKNISEAYCSPEYSWLQFDGNRYMLTTNLANIRLLK